MDIVRRVWREYAPFDYEGEFYRLAQAHSQVRSKQRPHVPLYFGGASEAALDGGRGHAGVYALWGGPVAAIKGQIADIRLNPACAEPVAGFSTGAGFRGSAAGGGEGESATEGGA